MQAPMVRIYERIGELLAGRACTPQEQRVEHEDKQTADKAELLAQHAKDEVRMFFGQEREVRLRTLAEPLAGKATRTDCRQRLQHLVAVTERVAHRVEEGIHAFLLVRFQHVPDHRTRIARKDVGRKENYR